MSLYGKFSDKRARQQGRRFSETVPQTIFVGECFEWAAPSGYEEDVSPTGVFRRPISILTTMDGASLEMSAYYSQKAFMSVDGLLRPISLGGDGGLPQLVVPTLNVPSIEPSGVTAVHQADLIPLQNPSGMEFSRIATDRSDTPSVGHDIEMVGRSGSLDGTPLGGLNMVVAGDNIYGVDYQDDYRFFAIRGPIIVTQWGFDIDGYPVPNKADNDEDASQGILVESGLDPNKFLDGHLRKSHTWVSAPLDLRLNRARGVWTIGSICDSLSSLPIRDQAEAGHYMVFYDPESGCYLVAAEDC